MNPAEWEEIDALMGRVFAEQGAASFDREDPPGSRVADPSECPLYRALVGRSPDDWLVTLGVLVAVSHCPGYWVSPPTVERWTGHLASRVGWAPPTASTVASVLQRLVATGVLATDRRDIGPSTVDRFRAPERATGDFSTRQVLSMAATDGVVPDRLVDAALDLLATHGRR